MITIITVFFRSILLYGLVVLSLRLLGKRQVGELEPSELCVTVLISELAAIPMQDMSAPLLSGIIPVLVLITLEIFCSLGLMKSARFRILLCGKPSIIISDGKPDSSSMRKNRLTVDELMEELRENGIRDIASVKCAILETSGRLSVFPYASQSPLTPAQTGIDVSDSGMWTIIINDGRLMEDNLRLMGYDGSWLHAQLRKNRVSSPEEVFILSVSEEGEVYFAGKEECR